jgi:hypothetical protein
MSVLASPNLLSHWSARNDSLIHPAERADERGQYLYDREK